MTKNKYKWRMVISAVHHYGGMSIFPSKLPLGGEWELKLECGHTVSRPCRYTSLPADTRAHLNFGKRRGWYYRRNYEDVLPAPKKVRCERCPFDRDSE